VLTIRLDFYLDTRFIVTDLDQEYAQAGEVKNGRVAMLACRTYCVASEKGEQSACCAGRLAIIVDI
jgi:hypothetical protein